MMAFPPNEDEKLIELVHKNSPIYDVRLPSYKDNIVRDNIWEVIGKELNKSSNECKKRWKYIRDSYNRCKRKTKLPTGSSALCKTTKWMLFERLRFLDNIPIERRSTGNIQDEINKETNIEGTSGLRRISEEKSGGGTSNEGISGAGIDTGDTIELRSSEERSGGEMSNEGIIGAGICTAGKKYRKRKSDDNIQTSLLEYMKQRDKQRRTEMRTLRAQELVADIDGIDSFCTHMGSVLKQLPPALRVEAKTKLFNILTEFELKSLHQSSSSALHHIPCSPDNVSSPTPEPTDLRTYAVYEGHEEKDFF